MSILKIVKYGNPVLREKGELIDRIDKNILKLIDDMCETMLNAPGLGLAAPQVEKNLSLFVLDMSYFDENGECVAFINPEIIEQKGISAQEEGCLSVPGINEEIKRPEYVKISALDINGKEFQIEGTGLLARAIMHEYDHIQGILIVDRLSSLKRKLIASKLKRISREEQV